MEGAASEPHGRPQASYLGLTALGTKHKHTVRPPATQSANPYNTHTDSDENMSGQRFTLTIHHHVMNTSELPSRKRSGTVVEICSRIVVELKIHFLGKQKM